MNSSCAVLEDVCGKSHWFEKAQIFFGFFCLVFLLNACGVVSSPSAMKQMDGSFSHAGITGNCAGCHDTGASFAVFPTSGHPDRKGQDCSSCHNVVSWTQGMVSHTPTPLECSSCHGAAGSAKAVPVGLVNKMDHSFSGLPDCASCHSSGAGVTWAGALFPHLPTPSTCTTCHASEKPVTLVNQMYHLHTGLPDCASCHTQNTGTSWSGGTYNHLPSPTTCQDCHEQNRPANHNVGQDCVGCHHPGTSWTN